MRMAVARSGSFHRLITRVLAPAMTQDRRRPKTPSLVCSSPSPVSQSESVRSSVPICNGGGRASNQTMPGAVSAAAQKIGFTVTIQVHDQDVGAFQGRRGADASPLPISHSLADDGGPANE